MKTSEADILIVPGLGGGNNNYWYARWETKLKTARLIEQKDWQKPRLSDWADTIIQTVEQAERSVVLVAHSLGVVASIHASENFPHQKVAGGYFVALPDMGKLADTLPETATFKNLPEAPLTFPSILVASQTDPYCDFSHAENMSYSWGSKLENAGDCGHINAESGQGPWPEGLLSFANFMAQL